jgi:hypothetical protein
VLVNAGHLQSLINPPGASKSFFFAAPAEAGPGTGPVRSGAVKSLMYCRRMTNRISAAREYGFP